MRRPGRGREPPHQRGGREAVDRVVRQSDRQESREQRAGRTPEPEILVQRVQHGDENDPEQRTLHDLVFITRAAAAGQAGASARYNWVFPRVRRLVRMLFRSARFLLVAALVAPPFVTAAAAQTTGNIVGTVEDSNAGVLPGVVITARNVETELTRTVVTGAEGRFVVPLLPPGEYQ